MAASVSGPQPSAAHRPRNSPHQLQKVSASPLHAHRKGQTGQAGASQGSEVQARSPSATGMCVVPTASVGPPALSPSPRPCHSALLGLETREGWGQVGKQVAKETASCQTWGCPAAGDPVPVLHCWKTHRLWAWGWGVLFLLSATPESLFSGCRNASLPKSACLSVTCRTHERGVS